ncbi:sulfite exporter TauE/SafE family protein [Algibacter sp. PT7-4]|uniref:sulfite exporter TauE/SafE family protein n=1 Tax=Algibacter ulvanivorans TaxID=3400999 RepID=UPI003AAF9A48
MLFSAFILGLLGSFHCIGMCGPIAFMLPVDRTNAVKKTYQITIYHIGRLFAYSLIGLVFGLIGKGLSIFGFQQQLSIIIGVLMILIVITPQKTFNKYNFSKPVYKIIYKVKLALGTAFKRKTMDTFLTIGFLNGFLPCGLVYMALFAAMAGGNATNGVLYMVVFGLGTIPLMTTAIYFSHVLKGKARQHIQNIIPVFVIIIGALFIIRGLGLGIPYLSPAPVYNLVSNGLDCH